MSGFRKNHNCQDVLLRFVEKCKWSIDNNYAYGAILTDLSKAFDCLPHRLIVSKLNACGLHERAFSLLTIRRWGKQSKAFDKSVNIAPYA